jgi:Dehydrogenases with different specificities (related to short-chain alcohol dehydrogenases)
MDSASKAGIVGMSKRGSIEYAKKNITINGVSPGFIVSEMTNNIPEKIRIRLIAKIPMGRMGSGEDVSNCVAFLSSEEASYVTGETIHVKGGMYMP